MRSIACGAQDDLLTYSSSNDAGLSPEKSSWLLNSSLGVTTVPPSITTRNSLWFGAQKKFSGSSTFTRIPQLEQNGIRANNNQHKANVLGNQFQAVNLSSDYPQAFTRNLPTLQGDVRTATLATRERDPRINTLFSMNELKTAISETKNTAPGHDQICYEMFKASVPRLSWNRSLFVQHYLVHRRSPKILATFHRHSNLQTWQTV